MTGGLIGPAGAAIGFAADAVGGFAALTALEDGAAGEFAGAGGAVAWFGIACGCGADGGAAGAGFAADRTG